MKWSDLSRIESLLTQRKELLNDRARVANGQFDCSILGRYQRDYLTDAELSELNAFMDRLVDRRLADVDARLLDLGVTIDPEAPESPDPDAPSAP